MEIFYSNPSSSKMPANVWHNGEEHQITSGKILQLNVKKGDKVQYRVGRFAAKRTIDFQSTSAKFSIETNRQVQLYGLGAIMIMFAILYFAKLIDNTVIATIFGVVAVALFEAVIYFRGYKATVVH